MSIQCRTKIYPRTVRSGKKKKKKCTLDPVEIYLQHEWDKRGKGSDKNKNESSYRQESARHESNQNIHSFIMVKFSLNDKEALLLVESR